VPRATRRQAAGRGLRVPSAVTARIQEMHITLIHAVSELVDRYAAEQDITR
jgi:hypothetical protein